MKNKFAYIAVLITFLIAAITVLMSGCSSYTETETTTEAERVTQETTKSYNNYNYSYSTTRRSTTSSYTSSKKSSYSYGGYSYSTTSAQTYKQDDPYYKANDYNNDGKLSQEEFQGAVNDWLDDHGY